MDAAWIVSANAGRARFFSQENWTAPLTEINDMVNATARMRTAETESDELGQRSASKSRHSVGAPTQPSGYQPNQTPEQHHSEVFARNIADFLRQGQQEGRFKQLFLVASPEFLGELRQHLDPNVASAVGLEINKDYTQSSGEQLREQIQSHKK